MNNLPFGYLKAADSPGFLLWQTTMIWQRQIKKSLEHYDISHAQFVIIATLMWFDANNYDVTQVLIVTQTKLDKMTVSKSLKKLASLGFVNRIEHTTDTRAKSVTLTNKGKEMLYILVPIVEGIDAKFFGTIPKTEKSHLVKLLSKLSVEI